MNPGGLALRTPDRRYVAEKSWPLAGPTPPGVSAWKQADALGLIGSNATYSALYKRQTWVHVCVNKLARGIARLPLKTYSLSSATGEREEERSSPVAKLLRGPWPRARTFQLVQSAVSYLAIYGNATFVKFRGGNGRTPAELWPMPWPQVEVIPGRDQPVESYRWTGRNGVQKVFLADDVVHLQWFNPDANEPFGVSPLEALVTTLALENASLRYSASSFGNAVRPASFIKSERNLTRQQRKELREEIEQAYGGPENAFKVALLDNGLDWKALGFSSSEAQLVDTRKLGREEVCAVYDMPPPMVGILDHATYSNIDEQHQMLYMDCYGPVCSNIESTFMAQLIDPEPAWDGSFCEFDIDGVLRGNIEKRSTAYQRFLTGGVYTPNELRKLENLEPNADPQADAIYVPVNLDPVSPKMRELADAQDAAQREQAQAERQARVDAQAQADANPPASPPAPSGGGPQAQPGRTRG